MYPSDLIGILILDLSQREWGGRYVMIPIFVLVGIIIWWLVGKKE